MSNVVEFEKPEKDLRVLARAIAYGVCPYDDALDLLLRAYNLGRADGERKAYVAQTRANEAATERRRQKTGGPSNG